MRIRELAFATLVCGSLFGGCTCKGDDKHPTEQADAEATTASKNAKGGAEYDATHLDEVAKKTVGEITTLETTKDVTCWTSFRQLDSFISSKEYSNFAALSKITA